MALFLKHFPFLFFEVPSLCIPQFGCRETTLRSKTKKKIQSLKSKIFHRLDQMSKSTRLKINQLLRFAESELSIYENQIMQT